jgi:hypothetical protein
MKSCTVGVTGRVLAAALGWSLLLAQAASGAEPGQAPMPAQHPVGCGAYDIEIANELKLLDAPGIEVKASGSPPESTTLLEVTRTYRVALVPQAKVSLRVTPRRHVLEEGAHAGMFMFTVPKAGTWRVSTTRETWIEVAGPAGAVKSSRFQGREGCPQMRKLVEFPLEAGTVYTLQLSGGVDPEMKLVITGPITAP